VLNLVKEDVKYYGNSHYSKEQVDRKVDWIASQLIRMNAGVVGFEEVFHGEPLQRAITKSGLYTGGELVTFGADGTGPTVALVSCYPVLEKHTIKDFPPEAILKDENGTVPLKSFARPVLKAVIRIPTGDHVTVWVAHLKSKRPITTDDDRHNQKAKAVGHALSLVHRAAEAAALRCLVIDDMRTTHRPSIVLGDLNDTVHSVTTEIITGTQPWKKMSLDQKQEIWETLLWSTNEVQVRSSDRDVTYSHIHNGRYEVLDHVLVSGEFVRSNPDHLGYVQYLQLYNDHLVDSTLSDEFQNPCESDHGQAVACIRLYPRDPDEGKVETRSEARYPDTQLPLVPHHPQPK